MQSSKLGKESIMRFLKLSISALLLILFLSSCGGDPQAEGDEAYAQGKYSQALNFYLEAKKGRADKAKINEKIALTYMQRGLQFFKKRHNLASFIRNFEIGEERIPEQTSESFNKEYSKLLYELAMAYHQTAPANEIQKEQYFTKTLEKLDDALTYDENNLEAEKALNEIRKANFEKTFEKGLGFYKKALKEKNPDLFMAAERYLKRAVSFNAESAQAKKYLSRTRKKTLSIVDMEEIFPIAVADYKHNGKFLLIAFTAINNSGEPFTFDPAQVKLVDFDDNEYAADAKQTAKFEDGLKQPVTLQPRKQLDGTLAFALSGKIKISHIKYVLDDGDEIVKYFP